MAPPVTVLAVPTFRSPKLPTLPAPLASASPATTPVKAMLPSVAVVVPS